MHTRYSPIRHSHGAEAPIPSDLHVLSLPLAFILSQDQTLHCRNCCRPAPWRRPVILRSRYASFIPLLFLLLAALPQRSSAPAPSSAPLVLVGSGGKDRAFPRPRQILPGKSPTAPAAQRPYQAVRVRVATAKIFLNFFRPPGPNRPIPAPAPPPGHRVFSKKNGPGREGRLNVGGGAKSRGLPPAAKMPPRGRGCMGL